MSGDRCFLCAKINSTKDIKFKEIANCRVLSSLKPIQTVLQHLANCIKTKLVFQPNDSICPQCYKQLSEYDSLMVNLLLYQKKLTQKLNDMLTAKIEPEEGASNEYEVVDVGLEDNLADAFNPELDAQEEFISVVEEDTVQDGDGVMEENESTIEYNDDSGDETVASDWNNSGRRRSYQECIVCGVRFKSKVQLQYHVRSAHNIKSFTCNICGAVRRDEEYLELHMNIHEGKTENECRYCDKRYSRPVNTLRHMRKHWDKKKYQCEKCGERFSLDNMLYNHRMLHEAEENPLICSVCNQSFKSRKTFNHHMIIHMDNRPRHQCTLCSKSFTERYTLKMHMKTHGVELSPIRRTQPINAIIKEEGQEEETDAAVTALVENTIKEFSCVICNTQFEEKETLELHLQNDHDVILK